MSKSELQEKFRADAFTVRELILFQRLIKNQDWEAAVELVEYRLKDKFKGTIDFLSMTTEEFLLHWEAANGAIKAGISQVGELSALWIKSK